MADILGNSSDSDNENELKINKSYAENYDRWRGKEELQKYASRYGEAALAKLDDSDDESSTSTEEDEDAKELTPAVEKQFFKTLSCLKKRDPRIYDANTRFFDKKEENPETEHIESADKKKKKKKDKAMFLRDYERKLLLEHGGHISSDEEDVMAVERAASPTFVEEQRKIKQSFQQILHDSSDEETGNLLRPRTKTSEEQAKEDEDYRLWLRGQKEELGDEKDVEELSYLKSYWNDPKLEKGEAFLKDYILNKRYLELEDKERVPTYDEVVHDSEGLSDDERTVEKMDQFEHKYNFRFEEPDQEFVKRFPRTMTGSLRQKDDRRKVHRDEVKERKEREKEAKRQELKQLKAIKRKEIAERLEKLKQITGNTDVQFEQEDLNEDFDPEKHDQRMQNLFNSEFYEGDEEEEKPQFPDLDEELEIENWDQYEAVNDSTGGGSGDYEPHCEDPDFIMDCDYDPRAALEQEMIEAQQSGRKKSRKRSRLAQLLAKKKPRFDPNQQQLEQYMDEYYSMDYEDLIGGDLPCRFKYRNVVPNSYGLTIEEILMADDKELNRWCSLKKTCQYRPENKEWYEVQAYNKKASLEDLKRRILPSLYKHENAADDDNESQQEKKKKKKKKRKKNKQGADQSNGISAEDGDQERDEKEITENKPPAKKFKISPSKDIKSEKESSTNATDDMPPEPPSKKQKIKVEFSDNGLPCEPKKKESKNASLVCEDSADNSAVTKPVTKKKMKKKKKHNLAVEENEPVSPTEKTERSREESGLSSKLKSKKRKASPYPDTQHGKKKKYSDFQSDKKKKQKKKSNNSQGHPSSGVQDISDSRLKAYGINPKKFKNKMKYGKK